MKASKKVSEKIFFDFLENSPASTLLKKQYAKYKPVLENDFYIHEGDIKISGKWIPPGYATIIVGNVTVDGIVSAENRNPEKFEEGGLLIIIGNVTCDYFLGDFGKCIFIDGNLSVKELLVNSYEDSSLSVMKDLKTKFFYGEDIWAEVGGTVNMEYGVGYCLPVNYKDAEEAIEPRNNEETSLKILTCEDSEDTMGDIVQKIEKGKKIFK